MWTLFAPLWQGCQVFGNRKYCDRRAEVWLNLKSQEVRILKCMFKEVHSKIHRKGRGNEKESLPHYSQQNTSTGMAAEMATTT